MKLCPSLIALALATLPSIPAAAQPSGETPSISLSIVLDTSGSMAGKLTRARQLVSELLKSASPQDEIALIQTADRPVVVSGYGSSADELQTKTAFLQSKGRSAILDGIYTGLHVSKAGRNAQKIVLVISDGGDNSSRYTETEVKNAIAETGVRVFVIGFDDPASVSPIAERGGGRYVSIDPTSDIPQIALDLVTAMRTRP